ncbi:MAG: succinylglutamate desuccinylase/aspartoacylase family protein [Bdellovibrionales bacterium]|nr:succinylglutamate desuccinylase/aspartoacylase family protein [Bdellovibrionales bacterium]
MSDIKLNIFDGFPDGLEKLTAENIKSYFDSPSLVFVKGKLDKPVFLSTLLHGNELSGLEVLKKIFKYSQEHILARDLIVFIGNVDACEKNQRFLDGQRDYNRIWSEGESPEHRLAKKVKEIVSDRKPFACIDIHNNTGLNPLYACINALHNEYQYLASLFSRAIVYFQNPSTALSVAFSQICPSVTVECGQSLDMAGVEKSYQFVLDTLNHSDLHHDSSKLDIKLYHTVVQVKIDENQEYDFFPNLEKLTFVDKFEQLNFTPLEPGFVFATVNSPNVKLSLFDDDGVDLFNDYLELVDGQLLLKRPVTPSMLTMNRSVIRKDCLGYFMEEVKKISSLIE